MPTDKERLDWLENEQIFINPDGVSGLCIIYNKHLYHDTTLRGVIDKCRKSDRGGTLGAENDDEA